MAHVGEELALGSTGGLGGFFGLLQFFFRMLALGNVHQGALVADHTPGKVADGSRIIEANDRRAVLPPQSDFLSEHCSSLFKRSEQGRALAGIEIETAHVHSN